MGSHFAYSFEMQLLLAVQSYFTNTLITLLIANLILTLANQEASMKQKLKFAVWIGAVFYTTYIYLAYFIMGMVSFSPTAYILVVGPNPILGYLYYYIGVRTLNLSPIRSIKLMGYFFTYFVFIVNVMRLNIAFMPIETFPQYNYLQNAGRQGVYLIIVIVIYYLTKFVFNKTKLTVRLADRVFIDIKRERIIFLLKLLFLYSISTFLPMILRDNISGSVIVILILVIFFAYNIVLDLFASTKLELENKEVHINILSKAVNEFSSVKHDFYNILQTYNGYLEVGNLDLLKKYHASVISLTTNAGNSIDLSSRMDENPSFISLLANKLEYAERMKVEMTISLQCSAEDLYIDNLDLCRCVVCLLDNAIEAASLSEAKKVFFTLELKNDDSKLIIVTNSTAEAVDIPKISIAGNSSKSGHQGLGLANVRNIMAKYGNCAFYMTYYNFELSAYIELKRS